MDERRKKHSWSFWFAIAVVVLPMLYFSSCVVLGWGMGLGLLPNSPLGVYSSLADEALEDYFAPWRFVVKHAPKPIGDAMIRSCNLFDPAPVSWRQLSARPNK